MGRAIMALIDRELANVADASVDDSPVLAQPIREELARREAEIANREQAVAGVEERQRGTTERLRRREAELHTLTQRVEMDSKLAAQRGNSTPKVGRNDRCPCGSGLKDKYCHGLRGRPPNVVSR